MADILEAIKPQQQQEQQQPPPPQPFEIALIRKIESKTSSVRNAFLLLDIDGDGRITPSDVRTVLHNELGLDLTTEQEECLISRIHQFHKQKKESESESGTNNNGMGYAEFAKYFQQVSSATLPSSQAGSAAAMGFHRQNTEDVATTTTSSSKPLRTSGEMPIHLSATTIIHQKRHQLRQLLSSHSSREGAGSSGMKETSLFLKIDVHRSAKVTMSELLHWINEVGMFDWTMDDLKEVVLNRGEGAKKEDKSGEDDEQLLELKWFGSGNTDGEKGEAGMTERDFAEFVESLDGE